MLYIQQLSTAEHIKAFYSLASRHRWLLCLLWNLLKWIQGFNSSCSSRMLFNFQGPISCLLSVTALSLYQIHSPLSIVFSKFISLFYESINKASASAKKRGLHSINGKRNDKSDKEKHHENPSLDIFLASLLFFFCKLFFLQAGSPFFAVLFTITQTAKKRKYFM